MAEQQRTQSERRVVFACKCSQVLEAPAEWIGREVRCLACRAVVVVPSESDPGAVRKDLERAARLAEARRKEPAPQRGRALAATPSPAEPRPEPRPAALPADEVPLSALPRWASVTALVLIPMAVLAAAWMWYRRTNPLGHEADAAASVSAPPRASRAEAEEILRLERDYENSGNARPQADKLAVVYRKAATVPVDDRKRANLCNNAAWFYATTPHLALREPGLALDLAQIAVDLSAGTEPNYLDTLAEALYLNRRYADAVETEKRALRMLPDAAPDFRERFEKYAKALATPPL